MTPIFFLPGAGGAAAFWRPVGERLPAERPRRYFAWPGLGDEPHDPHVASLDDLVRLVDESIAEPVDLVTQSMGGVIAARLALARPDRVRRLVLTATSAGVDMARFGASDWRPGYRASYPNAAAWITAPAAARELPVERILAPTQLLWGDADPISPVAVGQHLRARLPDAQLHVIAGGTHSFAQERPDEVATLIAAHLRVDRMLGITSPIGTRHSD